MAMGRPILPRPITPTRSIAASLLPRPMAAAPLMAKLYAVWRGRSRPRGEKLHALSSGRPADGAMADAAGRAIGQQINCMQLRWCVGTVRSGRMLAMPRVVQVPDIRKVDLPEARQAIPYVHAYLRECILNGTLSPGTKLSQVSLAAQLGISRTPLREVLRMLQEEGLVGIEPNQRTRVAGLDPQELDDVYASRILLETLALSMTLEEFTPAMRSARGKQPADRQRALQRG